MNKFIFFNDSSEEVNFLTKDQIEKKTNSDTTVSDSKHTMASKTVWNIATVSDKPINNRLYSDKAIRETITDKRWLKKYAKPLLKNHDMYEEPLGRVSTASYYNHESGENVGDKVPDEVIKFFKDNKCFEEGTGSVILSLTTREDTCDKIENGLYLTSSQSSYTDSVTCSICGKDIYDDSCPHVPGREYELDKKEDKETCYAVVDSLFPVENSIVNRPANDTSTFFVSSVTISTDEENTPSNSLTDLVNEKKQFLKNKIKTNDSDGKPIVDLQEGVSMDTKTEKVLQSLKNTIKDNLLITLDLSDEKAIQNATEIFDGFSNEDLHNLNGLVNLIKGSFSDKIDSIKALDEEISSFKTQVQDKELEIEELKKTITDFEATKSEEQKAEEERIAAEEKAKAEEAAAAAAAEAAKKEADEAEAAKKEAEKDKKVPDFLEGKDTEKDTKIEIKTNDFFDTEESLF